MSAHEWCQALQAMNNDPEMTHNIWLLNQESIYPHARIMLGMEEPATAPRPVPPWKGHMHRRTSIPQRG